MYIFVAGMPSRISKWGNSLGVRIPKAIAELGRLEEGSLVEFRVEDGKISLQVVHPPEQALEELLKEVDEDNLHGEISTGPPVGREVW